VGYYSSALEVAQIFSSRGFKRCITIRGVDISPYIKNGLTSEQMYVISFITDPTVTGALGTRLKKVGVKYSTWRAWMRNSTFRDTFNSIASQLLEDNFHEVERGLLNSATKGDINAIKFSYEITGRWDPNKKNAMDVASVLASVVEIISKHVTNPLTLQAIAGELAMLSAANGIKTGRPVARAIEGEVIGDEGTVFTIGTPDYQVETL